MVGVNYYGPVIDSCSIFVPFLAPLPPVPAVTPLQKEQFAWELRLHPNQQQVQFALDGIRHGFKLGFCPAQKLKAAKKNEPSAHQHQSVIDDYLANEVSLGRVAGPFNPPPPLPQSVPPSDRYLLGMKWRNQYYVDLALPFGLRSAPFIFNAIADMVEWILVHSYQIPDLLHYLDDFTLSHLSVRTTRAPQFQYAGIWACHFTPASVWAPQLHSWS